MKRYALSLLCISLLIAGVLPTMRVGLGANKLKHNAGWQVDREAIKAAFAKGREILSQKQVPFDADALLSPSWRVNLAAAIAQMPEMENIRYESNPLSGAYIADTLYLPGRVEINGDTVILARHIIFEGSDVLIKGQRDIHLFPMQSMGVIGARLVDLPKEEFGQLLAQKILDKRKVNLWQPGYVRGHITLDTSGLGREEWLNSLNEATNTKQFVALGSVNENGAPGSDGADGTDGLIGDNGGTGSGGANGTCGTIVSVNGVGGSPGPNGTEGKNGTAGSVGGNGQDAGSILMDIPDGSSENFSFTAKGGDGGQGGKGGNGGRGGNGGNGGRGGNGADCPCAQGGPGDGGVGGIGGSGGVGGIGGGGGNGGNSGHGGSILVTYPGDYSGTILLADASGGERGKGGEGGAPGTGGSIGPGGGGGTAATNSNCPSQTAINGATGTSGNLGATGTPGAKGSKGTKGGGGSISITSRGPADNDGDGYSVEDGDCDDFDPDISPGGYEGYIYPPGGGIECELCADGKDNDCNGAFDLSDGGCDLCNPSPIVLDLRGDGFDLTSASNGVVFDILRSGAPRRYAWIQGDEAWLVLDRNANGVIDDGGEMFGNATPLRSGDRVPNGFIALAEFDADADGLITAGDPIYSQLRLWRDDNHNGTSEPDELLTLQSKQVAVIALDYRETRRRDRHGNQFRFRSHFYKGLQDRQKRRAVYDVFLTFEQP